MRKKQVQEMMKQIQLAFDDITKFQAKYGTTQGMVEQDKNKYWYGNENPDQYGEAEGSEFLIKDITRSELLFSRMIMTWKMFNRTAFEELFTGKDVTKAFKDRVGDRLFGGQVAAFIDKTTSQLIVENFTYETSDISPITNLPTIITIISDKQHLNGIKLSVKKAAIGFNNSLRVSELAYDMPQMEMIVNSYMALALSIRRAKPKTFIAGMDDDTLASDIKRAIESDNWIEFLNISAKQLQQLDIRFETGFKDKMEMIMGSLADFIKFKGFSSNGLILKKERQTETELNNNDEFKHYLVYNKIQERVEFAEQCREKLGVDINYDGTELLQELKGGEQCQDHSADKNVSDKE